MHVLSHAYAKLKPFAALEIAAALQDFLADFFAFVGVPVAYFLPPAQDEAFLFEIAVLRLAIAGWLMSRFLPLLSRVVIRCCYVTHQHKHINESLFKKPKKWLGAELPMC